AWAVPVVLFATSSRTTIMASSFSDADLANATALFAALVFAVPRDGTEGRADVVADTWYAALLTGVALGVKASAAPAALIVLAMMLLRARGGASTAHRGRRFIGAAPARLSEGRWRCRPGASHGAAWLWRRRSWSCCPRPHTPRATR